jgi:hypothetical protein
MLLSLGFDNITHYHLKEWYIDTYNLFFIISTLVAQMFGSTVRAYTHIYNPNDFPVNRYMIARNNINPNINCIATIKYDITTLVTGCPKLEL